MKARIVRGISDSYIVKEAVEAVTGEKFFGSVRTRGKRQ